MMRHVQLMVSMGLAISLAGAQGEGARVSDPCTDIAPGAASMEPAQDLQDPEEVEASDAHARWLGEIWTAP